MLADDVTVSVENPNRFLPVKVVWKVGDKTGEITGSGQIPVGDTRLMVEPYHKGAWHQWGEWCVNEKIVGPGFAMNRKTVKGDQISVLVLQQVPNFSGATVRIKGELALVWVEPDEGMKSWARAGEKKVVEQLTANFFDGREKKGQWGHFKASGINLYLPSTGNDVPKPLLDLKKDDKELTDKLTEALGIIRPQKPAIGDSVQELLRKAKVD